MNSSVTEPHSTGQDTDSASKEKGKCENNAGESSATRTVVDLPENVILEFSRDQGMDPPAVPSVPIPTSLTPIPPHLISETPNPTSTVRPRSRPASRDTSPYPRSRPSTPNRPSTPSSSSSSRPAPPRRSARTLAKAPERPEGPPELEAALTIAIRNLQSDIYEWWCANQKPGSPRPTTAYLKGRSPRIRRAAEAVDEADRLLNEAVYGKPKGRPPAKKSQERSGQASGEVPETAFGQLELNPQPGGTFLLQPIDAEGGSTPKHGGSGGQLRRSTRNKESTGD